MPVFRCHGCGIPFVTCTLVTSDNPASTIPADDLAGLCPKKGQIPVWRELGAME